MVISTSDRQVLTYDVSSGDLLHAYKTADSSDMITLGNIGLSKTFLFPPLMKVKTMGSPVPQGQVRPRSLLAGAGNDKVHYSLTIKANPSQLEYTIMIQGHYLPRNGPMQKVSQDYSGFLDLKTQSPVNHS
jgi:hypothetical protein